MELVFWWIHVSVTRVHSLDCKLVDGKFRWFRLELLGILCVFIYYSRFVFIFVIFSDSTSLPVVGVPTVVRKYRKNSRTAESSFQ